MNQDEIKELIELANGDLSSNERINDIVDKVRECNDQEYEELKGIIDESYEGNKEELIATIDAARKLVKKRDEADRLIDEAKEIFDANPENEEIQQKMLQSKELVDSFYGKLPPEEYNMLLVKLNEEAKRMGIDLEANAIGEADLGTNEVGVSEENKDEFQDEYKRVIGLMTSEDIATEDHREEVTNGLEDVKRKIEEMPDSEAKEEAKKKHEMMEVNEVRFYTIKHAIATLNNPEIIPNIQNAINSISTEPTPEAENLRNKLNELLLVKQQELGIVPKEEDPEKKDPEKEDPEKKDPEKEDPEKEDPEKEDPEKEDPEKKEPTPEDKRNALKAGKDEESIQVKIKGNKPEKTWKTAAAVAAGVGIGAGAFFIAGPGGCVAVAVAGLIAKKIIRKKRKELAEQRLLHPEQTAEVNAAEAPEGKISRAIWNMKNYLKSDEGLRDLEWLASAASISGAIGGAGMGIFNVVDFTAIPTAWAMGAGISGGVIAGGLTSGIVNRGDVYTTIEVKEGTTPEEIADAYGVPVEQIIMPEAEKHRRLK